MKKRLSLLLSSFSRQKLKEEVREPGLLFLFFVGFLELLSPLFPRERHGV